MAGPGAGGEGHDAPVRPLREIARGDRRQDPKRSEQDDEQPQP